MTSLFHAERHRRGAAEVFRSLVHAVRTLIRVFALGMPLILGCWTARSGTTNAVLTFHIVSEKKIDDGRFIDTPLLPKVGPKPMMTESCGLIFWLAVPGLFACLSGMALMFLPQLGHEHFGAVLAGGGFLLALGGTFLNAAVANRKRRAWPVVPAQCTHQQLEVRKYSGEGGLSDGWLWQVVCEIKYGGKQYAVSPRVHWSDLGQGDAPFWSEAKARQFISRKISPKGECQLRVNPDNPLEAELL